MTQILRDMFDKLEPDTFTGMTAFEVRGYLANEGTEPVHVGTDLAAGVKAFVQLMPDAEGKAFVCVAKSPQERFSVLCEGRDVADAQRIANRYNEALNRVPADIVAFLDAYAQFTMDILDAPKTETAVIAAFNLWEPLFNAADGLRDRS